MAHQKGEDSLERERPHHDGAARA